MKAQRCKLAFTFALAAGIVHLVIGFSFLFLPIFGQCLQSGPTLTCHWLTYAQQGGNIVGYAFFTGMIILGALVLINRRSENGHRVCFVRWIFLVMSAIVAAILGPLSYVGCVALPGALLMLLPALSCRRNISQ